MQEPRPDFNQTVEALLRPERPAPAEFVRVLVIHGGNPPPLVLDDAEAKIVHEQLAVSNNQRLDVKGAPDFDMVIADVTDNVNVLETVFRFLFVRRPPVFVLMNQYLDLDYLENVAKMAGDMGYAVSFEQPAGSLVGLAVGTLTGVSPGWIPTELLREADGHPFEFDAAWVINEAVSLAKIAIR